LAENYFFFSSGEVGGKIRKMPSKEKVRKRKML